MDVRGDVGHSWDQGKVSSRTDQGWMAQLEHEPQPAQGNSGQGLFRWMTELASYFPNVKEMPPSCGTWEEGPSRAWWLPRDSAIFPPAPLVET